MSEGNDLDELRARFGRIDIYVFDQLLRGHLRAHDRVLDAGCGRGRNSVYLMRHGADVFGVDVDPEQVQRVRALKASIAPTLPDTNFHVADLRALAFPDGFFDAVVCNAVLHFAEDEPAFESMVSEMFRVLRPGGLFFARLASTIGVEAQVIPQHGRWHRLPDGSERFLVDEDYLMLITERLEADWVDPLKTTVVQGMRSMTTWVLRR